jgi:DNA transformation protein
MMYLKLPQNNLPVTALRNLGPKSAVMLAEAGIRTIGELRAIGAAKAYVRVKSIRSRGTSVNLLWSMAAGLDGRGWQEVSTEEKTLLLAEVRRLRR